MNLKSAQFVTPPSVVAQITQLPGLVMQGDQGTVETLVRW